MVPGMSYSFDPNSSFSQELDIMRDMKGRLIVFFVVIFLALTGLGLSFASACETCDATKCGSMPDGCGDVIKCGPCAPGLYCNVNTCVNPVPCKPITCANLCGANPDGCGGVVHCPLCKADEICTPNGCVGKPCTAKTCDELYYGCGTFDDPCAGKVDCGSCPEGESCDQAVHQCVPSAEVTEPDKDGDGVPDNTDKCPDVKGSPDSEGCPAVAGEGDAGGATATELSTGAASTSPSTAGTSPGSGPFRDMGPSCAILPFGTPNAIALLLAAGAVIPLIWRRKS